MDTLAAFAMGLANQGNELRVFDWHKAARLIRESKPVLVEAGLSGDWEYTGGAIYADGKPVPREETYVYLSSNWAIPKIDIDGQRQDCFVMQSEAPTWDSGTYWPESALAILRGEASSEQETSQ